MGVATNATSHRSHAPNPRARRFDTTGALVSALPLNAPPPGEQWPVRW